jgi:hypothetical protein
MRAPRTGITRPAIAVAAFAVAMGYVEAAVVVDLRTALGLPAAATFPLQQAGPAERLALIELGREIATLVMLVSVGWAVGRRGWAWLAWTAVAFGIWDIAYYGWLAVFIGWPSSPFDLDLLFLIPVPWVGPVWAPVAVSLALVVFGLLAARGYSSGLEPVVRRRDVGAGLLGAALVLLSFTIDAPGILSGGRPGWFPWPAFIAGVLIASAGALDALRRGPDEPMWRPEASRVTRT